MIRFEYVEGSYLKHWYPEAATQSFKIGQPVYLNAGLLTECATDNQEVLGIALADASTTTNTWLPVVLATSDTVFLGSSIGNAGIDTTTAITDIGILYSLYESSNVVSVNLDDTDADCIKPIAVHPDHIPSVSATLVDSTNAKVLFKFIDAVMQFCDKEMT